MVVFTTSRNVCLVCGLFIDRRESCYEIMKTKAVLRKSVKVGQVCESCFEDYIKNTIVVEKAKEVTEESVKDVKVIEELKVKSTEEITEELEVKKDVEVVKIKKEGKKKKKDKK